MANLIYKGNKAGLPLERNATSFYLCEDTHELYFGANLYTEAVRFYDGEKPATPAQGVLYVENTTGAGDVWNGAEWKSVITPLVKEIAEGADDAHVATAKATKTYVDGKIQEITGTVEGLGALAKKDEVSEAELEATLKEKINGKVDSVAAADKSVDVAADPETPNDFKVKANISAEEKNALVLKGDGLYAPTAPEYTLTKAEAASEGAAATYHLTKDGVQVGSAIDIPKDMVVKSGSVKTFTEEDKPVGVPSAGTYIELVLANKKEDKLYINVTSLIEYVTSGSDPVDDAVVIAVSEDHKVTATINDGKITIAKMEQTFQDTWTKLNADEHTLGSVAEAKKVGTDAAAAAAAASSHADDLNTAMDERVTAAEGSITTLTGEEGVEGSVKKALKDAKDYSDGLAKNYDAAGAADAVLGTDGDGAEAATVYGAKAHATALDTAMGVRMTTVEQAITIGTF